MQRLLQFLGTLALASVCLGCPMPQTNYDWCAPTVDANGVPTGGFMTRQGSVLGGMPGPPVYAQQPTPASPPGTAPATSPPGTSTPAFPQGTPTPADRPAAADMTAQPVSAEMAVDESAEAEAEPEAKK